MLVFRFGFCSGDEIAVQTSHSLLAALVRGDISDSTFKRIRIITNTTVEVYT